MLPRCSFSASAFTLFTYIAPVLNNITHVSPRGVTYTLFLVGLGLTLGNFLGGKLADWRLFKTLAGIFLCAALVLAILTLTARTLIPAEITLFIWAMLTFGSVPALQINVVNFGQRCAEPHLHPQHRSLQRRQRTRRLGRRRSDRRPPRLRCDPPDRRFALARGPAAHLLSRFVQPKRTLACQLCLTR